MKRGGELERLALRYALDPTATRALDVLLDRLALPEAPTTVHARHEAIDVHLADSLVALELPAMSEAATVADLGAGAGVPALVLAAARPDLRVVAVESGRRKAAFIAETAAAMALGNVEVVPTRAEEWRAGTGVCDVVTARALGALPVVAEYAAPLLRMGGTLVAWKGAVDETERNAGQQAAALLGLRNHAPVPVVPYRGSARRTLHLYSKVAQTPGRFPRRPGMASKRPLGADRKPRPEAEDRASTLRDRRRSDRPPR